MNINTLLPPKQAFSISISSLFSLLRAARSNPVLNNSGSRRRCAPRESGFSLVELSIVLVILGLLTGGILTGQNLIRAAQIRAVTTEFTQFYTATITFRDKYMALPGDMPNATKFWGSAANGGTGGACNAAITSAQATCNGNGNGQILAITAWETVLFWQHMANAGLINATITNATACCVPGANMPASKLGSNTGYYIGYAGKVTANTGAFDGEYGNSMNMLERPVAKAANIPEEVWNMDVKIDDGKPGTGRLVAPWSNLYSQGTNACTTATSGADLAADYNLQSTTKDCFPSWRNF